ncbi:tRNA (adenosine(37)-N6)-dimethylallyltransferase MiaA [Candidatus Saccharibacteria bacterium]|nr:tRNA (adenosine(37)-N6)-dimethylallyltransferase MiaA [Candidatus Saccharibacteria bacterium]MCL1963098.1 tRNA (adenosine(37)-N6)-dimethylallyltransferase MiaA [Candidatus Saccharibacteria bacterium]
MAAIGKPLIVIVGPTASGKTGIAIKLAKKYGGEIISADSRAIYKYMDIGTAKPTPDEQNQVQHWGIDLVEPNERFTVADFQKYANTKIADIRARGKIPFLVGGSGLYIDGVIYDYEFGDDVNKNLRAKLEKMSVEDLQKYCRVNNINPPENDKNKRYLMREIERQGIVKNNRKHIRPDTTVVGITTDKEELQKRIADRAEQMFNGEIEAETQTLAKKYSFDLESMKSNIYPIVWRMINGEISRDEAVSLFQIDDWHLVKKQITWFRRNPEIKWLPLDEIERYIFGILCDSNEQ